MPAVAWFSLFMICAGLTLPRTSGRTSNSPKQQHRLIGAVTDYSLFYYFLLWFALLSVSMAYIYIHGIDYVSWPKLIPPTDIIYYNGPGFRSGHHGKGLKGVSEPSWQKTKWLPAKRGMASVDVEVELGTIKKRVD